VKNGLLGMMKVGWSMELIDENVGKKGALLRLGESHELREDLMIWVNGWEVWWRQSGDEK